MTRIFLAALFLCSISAPAFAFDRHDPVNPWRQEMSQPPFYQKRDKTQRVKRTEHRSVASTVIGGRPSGCPHRFCGCALSIKLFGRRILHLDLAANWKAFPQTVAAPGMVAARYGHVFELKEDLGGGKWLVWDANSGGGRIRIHARSIAGYTIHNPNGTMTTQRFNARHAKRRSNTRYARAGG